MMLLNYVCLLVLFVAGSFGQCPANWDQNGDTCYYFSFKFGQSSGWHEAQSKCESMSGDLTVINDDVENTFLFGKLGDNTQNWIGLHDIGQEGQWQWVDGSSLTYAAWADGQPDNWEGAAASQEDCVEILQNNGGLWNDAACNIRHNFVCERALNAVPSPNCQESDGWAEYEGRCYLVVDDKMPWVEASKSCQAIRSQLVHIGSQAEQLYVANEVNNKNVHFWTGLSTVGDENNQLFWSNGEAFTPTSYNNWLPGQPIIDQNSDNCVEINPDLAQNGPWVVDRCGNGHSFICETAFTGTCAPGWRLFAGNCYFWAVAETAWQNWVNANALCEGMGAKLMRISNDDQEKYVIAHLPEFSDAGSPGVWLGFSDTEDDGVFVWTDGESATTANYKIFGPNQPRDQPGAYDCGQIFSGSTSGVWETDDCFKAQGFICQLPTGVDPIPLDPPASTHKGCDPGWIWFDSNCYYFEHNKQETWQAAEDTCIGYGGHLASILTGEENAFVTSHTNENMYFGANDIAVDNQWVWSDGSPWTFSDWYPGEPNYANGCGQLWAAASYKWDDVPCNNVFKYICKKHEQECWEALGMEDGRILEKEITSSSYFAPGWEATEARLNNVNDASSTGAWSPQLVPMDCSAVPSAQRLTCNFPFFGGMTQESCTANGCCFDGSNPNATVCFAKGVAPTPGTEWIQVKLIPARTVSGVTTQGRPADLDQYVTTYQVATSSDGTNFDFVRDRSGITQTFTGNVDSFTPVSNRFNNPVVASYVRIYPHGFTFYPTLRMEVMGCSSTGGDLPTPSPDQACTSVPSHERLDCGFAGIDAATCRSKGCCWDSSQLDTLWCFYPKDQYDPRCGKDFSYDPHGQIYCYHFNDYQLRTWSQAREYCQGLGADLLSINSKAENSYVSGQVSNLVLMHALWVGANRNDPESGWKWSNGQPFNYVYWADGEPNGRYGNEHCVELYTSDSKWNDISCDVERGTICKKFANSVPPIPIGPNEYVVNICEGETQTLFCPQMQIVINHASYGRSSALTCNNGHTVPSGGCHSSDTMDMVSSQCNNQESCTLTASNAIYGDPCHGVYKYLNVIYTCEQKACFVALGMEDGRISDSQISESSSIDNNHRGTNARLNGDTSWATQEGTGSWVQVTFPSNLRVTGFITQGAGDQERWVTKFKVSFANDNTFTQWTDYHNLDGNVMNFTANSDRTTEVRVVLAEHIFTPGVRIYPLGWNGDVIGMRFDVTGCHPLRELQCTETGDLLFLDADSDTVVQAECPPLCPIIEAPPVVFGTSIYSGSSQICSAAVHAGVIVDRYGGAITLMEQTAQSTYVGSVRNNVVSRDLDYYPMAFTFANNEKNCEAGWIPYGSYCYFYGPDLATWAQAEANCVQLGGHLTSIRDATEQDFVTQQVLLGAYMYVWIGLNDLRSVNEYEWIDGEPVVYTNWEPFAPDNWEGKNENCGEIFRDTLKWNDYLCDDIGGYICRKLKDYYPDVEPPTPPPGCPEGWIPYEGTCYLFQRDLVTEVDSEAFCEGLGGFNVHVQNKFVQSFLHTVIGAEDWRWWLGLHALISGETGVSWVWESGDDVTYDNWGVSNPDINQGECAVFYGGPFGNGMWYSNRCEQKAYSICEKQRDGWTDPPITVPPPVGGCAHDWVTPGAGSNFCYKIFAPEAAGKFDKKQGWENARQQCLTIGGDLVSIHNQDEEIYLSQELSKIGVISQYVWIGLNNKNGIGWSWSDGSAVQYVSWSLGSPTSDSNTCVAMKYEPLIGIGFWENLSCLQAQDWICKIPKGIEPVEPTDPPTGIPNVACGSESAGTWIEYEGMCYLFNDQEHVSRHVADETCKTQGGELVSVHSGKTSSFITNQVKQMPAARAFWIGLRETGGVNGEYVWSDETAVDYVNWNIGEPNDAHGIEQCVTLYGDNGQWNDENCGLEIAGYICKKYLGAPPNPPQPTQPLPGGCPANWLMYSNYCYQIHGEISVCDPADTDNADCAASWFGAVEQCNLMDSFLLSIHNKYENAFITAHASRVNHNMWIGMTNDLWGIYTWANGDDVTYTNWNAGEPNNHNEEENCVELIRSEAIAGRWNDKICGNNAPYICAKLKDAGINPGQEINNNKKCPSGWMQFDAVNDNYMCYLLDNTLRTFDEAQENCRSLGADLASLQTNYEQAFITSYIKDVSAWIGMRLNVATSEWMWVDEWPVWISNWGEGEPTPDPGKQCVVNKDSLFGSEWVTASCGERYASVCKTSTETIPPTPGYIEGDCEDSTWNEYGGYCIKAFVTTSGQYDPRSWNDAEAECQTYAGHLASFTSRHEVELMKSWYNTTEALWIGLRNNGQGGWSWVDGRPVSFMYWSDGEPNNAGENAEDCVEMYGDTGKWNDISCFDLQGYMCISPKALGTDSDGNVIRYTTPAPPDEHGEAGNGPIIAGVIIGILLAVLLIAGTIVYMVKKQPDTASKIAESASEIPSGIVNKLYSLSGSAPPPTDADQDVSPPVHYAKDSGATVDDSKA